MFAKHVASAYIAFSSQFCFTVLLAGLHTQLSFPLWPNGFCKVVCMIFITLHACYHNGVLSIFPVLKKKKKKISVITFAVSSTHSSLSVRTKQTKVIRPSRGEALQTPLIQLQLNQRQLNENKLDLIPFAGLLFREKVTWRSETTWGQATSLQNICTQCSRCAFRRPQSHI